MVQKCEMTKELRNCPFYDETGDRCSANEDIKCGFLYKIEETGNPDGNIKNSYVRQPRWYEKYYQKK